MNSYINSYINSYYVVNLYYETTNFNYMNGMIQIPLTQQQATTLDNMIKMNRIDKFSKLIIMSYCEINQSTYNTLYELLNEKYYKVNNNTIPHYNIILSIGNILNQK